MWILLYFISQKYIYKEHIWNILFDCLKRYPFLYSFSFVFAFSIFMFFIIAIKNMKKRNIYFLQIHHNASKMCFYAIFMIGIYVEYASGVSEWEWVCRENEKHQICSIFFKYFFLISFLFKNTKQKKLVWFSKLLQIHHFSQWGSYGYIILYIYFG